MVNAIDLFHQMLRERIAPALRDHGFTGAGLEYRLREADPDHLLLGFQRSVSDTAERCRFTVNLRSVRYEDHEARRRLRPALGSRLSANRVGPDGWHTRIGALLGQPHDHWWTLTDEHDVARVADAVLTLILRYAVPVMWAGLTETEPLTGRPAGPGPGCLDPYCPRTGAEPWGADDDEDDQEEPDPSDLSHTLVMEIGERRSTYVLTFFDDIDDTEARLVIDGPWRLEQPDFGWVNVTYGRDGDVRVAPSGDSTLPTHPLALLAELTLCNVDFAKVDPDGSLLIAFEGGTPRETFLRVEGTGHALTVGRPWQFEGWTGVR